MRKTKKVVLIVGVVGNLGLLAYFKYANFFVYNFNALTGENIVLDQIILPLAISFFTFQQIAYLFDLYQGEAKEYDFLHYCLFVTFFPQLIAGPIVHHKEMLPQFARDTFYKLKAQHLAVGFTIFFMGLFKKVVVADGIAVHATPVFESAELGMALTFFEAWGAALAYTFQLYFDFSGYSDMAIGLARMFGVVLPANFFSPFKADNIIDFWRRWHMTLSRFFRDYLYIPLGGNRKGTARSFFNIIITMLLGGLWHGAGWTFVFFGALHGFYLTVNHGWLWMQNKKGHEPKSSSWLGRSMSRIITFTAVTVSFVLFRAETMEGAKIVYEGMLGMNGVSFPYQLKALAEWMQALFPNSHIVAGALGNFGSPNGVLKLFALLVLVWCTPNTLEWLHREKPALGVEKQAVKNNIGGWAWRPSIIHLTCVLFMAIVAIMCIQKESEFLYFQF